MNEANKNSLDESIKQSEETKFIKVWDLPVRIFHWSLVLLFIAAYVTNALGPSYFQYHLWTGYAVIVLVTFRIIWGIVGTYHARFINFVRNPITTAKYALATLKNKEPHYTGHNPLGAIMVVLLLLTILIQAITGLFANDEIFNLGPLYAYISDELSLKLTSLHRQLFYWILGAILLHIIAILIHLFFKKENLIKAMFTGKKSANALEGGKSISSSRVLLAVIIVIALATLLTWIIVHAPEVVSTEEY